MQENCPQSDRLADYRLATSADGRVECPTCGKLVRLNRFGNFRKHRAKENH